MYDIIFISYQEPNAEKNWKRLKDRFLMAKRIKGITGIHQAHQAAANKSFTDFFWAVDGDAAIRDDFNFDYEVSIWDSDTVHVWRSENPINGLTYGYGGVKLLPTLLTKQLDCNTTDMTTSISKKFKIIDKISNITEFNTDPFNTWKSAFRECVKLSSKIIDGQDDVETEKRLDIWCTVGADQKYGDYSIKGALMGKEFGTKYVDNTTELSKINDWKWLEDEFRKL